MQSGSVSGLGTQCGKTNSKSERYAYATSAAQMSCGTECITKLPLLLFCVSGAAGGGRKIDVRVVAGDRNTYPPRTPIHTPCCIRCPALAGNSHKAQLPINCIRRFHCVAHALVFASLERRDLSRVYICACAQDQSAPRASLFTPTNTYMYPHWQTEEETMSRKRPLIVDDQQ